MKKFILSTLVFCTALLIFSFAVLTEWKIADTHNISFSTSGANGVFEKFEGEILFNQNELASSKFEVLIDVESINTGNKLKNKHAKSDKWFDAENYPAIKFISKTFTKTDTAYMVTGDLNMHGISKEISIPFSFKNEDSIGVFSGTFSVNRNDFAIGKAGGIVGDIIKLNIMVPVRKSLACVAQ